MEVLALATDRRREKDANEGLHLNTVKSSVSYELCRVHQR